MCWQVVFAAALFLSARGIRMGSRVGLRVFMLLGVITLVELVGLGFLGWTWASVLGGAPFAAGLPVKLASLGIVSFAFWWLVPIYLCLRNPSAFE